MVLKLPVLLVNVMALGQVPPVPPALNVAVTLRAAVIDNTQFPVPLQLPLHPANVDPLLAVAVSVTDVPFAKFVVHVLPQLIPTGEEVTVPVPVPIFVTLRERVVVPDVLKVAVTDRGAVIHTVHAAGLVQVRAC